MHADPTSVGIYPTSGSLTLSRSRFEEPSRGAFSASASAAEWMEVNPWHQIASSFGSMVASYFQELVGTASAHTIIDTLHMPAVNLVADIEAIDESSRSQLRSVLREIECLTGLKKIRVAEDLLGVSKQAYNAWERGLNIKTPNLTRVLETSDVLRRASKVHSGAMNLCAWLNAPSGARAERPIDLLRAGEFGRARLLAISTAPPREKPVPDNVLRSTPDPWMADHLRWRSRPAADDGSLQSSVDE